MALVTHFTKERWFTQIIYWNGSGYPFHQRALIYTNYLLKWHWLPISPKSVDLHKLFIEMAPVTHFAKERWFTQIIYWNGTGYPFRQRALIYANYLLKWHRLPISPKRVDLRKLFIEMAPVTHFTRERWLTQIIYWNGTGYPFHQRGLIYANYLLKWHRLPISPESVDLRKLFIEMALVAHFTKERWFTQIILDCIYPYDPHLTQWWELA